jgi:hypothetical protein
MQRSSDAAPQRDDRPTTLRLFRYEPYLRLFDEPFDIEEQSATEVMDSR